MKGKLSIVLILLVVIVMGVAGITWYGLKYKALSHGKTDDKGNNPGINTAELDAMIIIDKNFNGTADETEDESDKTDPIKPSTKPAEKPEGKPSTKPAEKPEGKPSTKPAKKKKTKK